MEMLKKETIKVLLVDDHKIFREGVTLLLKEQDGIEVIGQASSGKEVKHKLNELRVDLVLLDINMPEMNGIEIAQYMIKYFPHIRILVFSSFDESHYIEKMIKIGVSGYILKTVGAEELLMAIKVIGSGNSYYCQVVSDRIRKRFTGNSYRSPERTTSKPDHTLTEREMEILRLVAQGLTNIEIGERLFISYRTVDTHRRNLLHKLGLRNSIEMVRYAFQHKLLE